MSLRKKEIFGEDRFYRATKAYIVLLQALFNAIEEFKWSEDNNSSKILITDQKPYQADETERRPIIVTARTQGSWASTSLDQRAYSDLFGPGLIHADLAPAGMLINVVAREGVEAQYIAWLIFNAIPMFRENLIRWGRLHAISNRLIISEERDVAGVLRVANPSDWTMVQIFSPFQLSVSQTMVEKTDPEQYNKLEQISLYIDDKMKLI